MKFEENAKIYSLAIPGEEVQYVMFMTELLMTTCELKFKTKLNMFLFCNLVSYVLMFDGKSEQALYDACK